MGWTDDFRYCVKIELFEPPYVNARVMLDGCGSQANVTAGNLRAAGIRNGQSIAKQKKTAEYGVPSVPDGARKSKN
jgi:hypothetical protein